MDNRCPYIRTRDDQPDFQVACYGKAGHEGNHWYSGEPDVIAGTWRKKE